MQGFSWNRVDRYCHVKRFISMWKLSLLQDIFVLLRPDKNDSDLNWHSSSYSSVWSRQETGHLSLGLGNSNLDVFFSFDFTIISLWTLGGFFFVCLFNVRKHCNKLLPCFTGLTQCGVMWRRSESTVNLQCLFKWTSHPDLVSWLRGKETFQVMFMFWRNIMKRTRIIFINHGELFFPK